MLGTKRLRALVVALAAVSVLSTAGLGFCHSMPTMYVLCVVRGLVSGMLAMLAVAVAALMLAYRKA
jgi:type IV secretory pathway VirB2 component (pilin)